MRWTIDSIDRKRTSMRQFSILLPDPAYPFICIVYRVGIIEFLGKWKSRWTTARPIFFLLLLFDGVSLVSGIGQSQKIYTRSPGISNVRERIQKIIYNAQESASQKKITELRVFPYLTTSSLTRWDPSFVA